MYDTKSGFETCPVPPQQKLQAAVRPKKHQIDVCIVHGRELLTKYILPENLSSVFGPLISTPDDELFTPPDWVLKSIKRNLVTITPSPTIPLFEFSTIDNNVIPNINLLVKCNYDFTKLIDNNQHRHYVIVPNSDPYPILQQYTINTISFLCSRVYIEMECIISLTMI